MNDVEPRNWRKSSYSANSGNCVELAATRQLVAVRDSKQDGRGPVLTVNKAAWRSFVADIKDGLLGV